MTGHVHVCVARSIDLRRIIRHCPTCERRRLMLAEHFEWYGWHVTCLTCGERWSDGERLQRPFAPRWREKSVARAKARFRRMTEERDG